MEFGLANPNAYRLVFCTRPREASEGAEKVAMRLGKELFDGFAAHVAEDHGARPGGCGAIRWRRPRRCGPARTASSRW